MKPRTLVAAIMLVMGFCIPSFADVNVLADWCVNVNGDTSACNGNAFVSPVSSGGGSVDLQNFDTTLSPAGNNLGTITVNLGDNGGLPQYVNVYMDYDLNYPNALSFQDSGSTNGSLPAGASWELNTPGNGTFGDFAANTLNDTNTVVTPSGPPTPCCDVLWALGLGAIDVLPGGSATVTFTVSSTAPTSGFYLQQTNFIDNTDSIYLSGNVVVNAPVTGSVPEPSAWLLLATLVGGIAISRKVTKRSVVS